MPRIPWKMPCSAQACPTDYDCWFRKDCRLGMYGAFPPPMPSLEEYEAERAVTRMLDELDHTKRNPPG